MSKEKLPIIIDCDPGVDDALALLILYKHIKDFDLKLLCASSGNTPIAITTRNCQFFAKNYFKGTKVAKGLDRPLVKATLDDAENVHGKTGLGNFDPGEIDYPVEEDSAKAMYEVLQKSKEPITIITIGPMTNVARLLVTYPDIKYKIREMYSMIGSKNCIGNITEFAEFNAYYDPEAFDIVAKSGIPITFNTMEIGEQSGILKNDILNVPPTNKTQQMIRQIVAGVNEIRDPSGKRVYVYDANSIIAITQPELYDYINCEVEVTTSKEEYGKCVLRRSKNGHCRYQVAKNVHEVKQYIINELLSI